MYKHFMCHYIYMQNLTIINLCLGSPTTTKALVMYTLFDLPFAIFLKASTCQQHLSSGL